MKYFAYLHKDSSIHVKHFLSQSDVDVTGEKPYVQMILYPFEAKNSQVAMNYATKELNPFRKEVDENDDDEHVGDIYDFRAEKAWVRERFQNISDMLTRQIKFNRSNNLFDVLIVILLLIGIAAIISHLWGHI